MNKPPSAAAAITLKACRRETGVTSRLVI